MAVNKEVCCSCSLVRKKAPFIANLRFEYSNSSVMLNMYISHTHFKTVVCATKLKAPQVGTPEYLHINISISKASTLNKLLWIIKRLLVWCLSREKKRKKMSYITCSETTGGLIRTALKHKNWFKTKLKLNAFFCRVGQNLQFSSIDHLIYINVFSSYFNLLCTHTHQSRLQSIHSNRLSF